MKFDLLCDLSDDRICGFVVILIDAIRKYLIGHQMVEALWVYAFRFVANFHCGIYGHSESAVLNNWTSLMLKLPVKSRRSDLQVIWHYSEVKLKIEIHRYGRPSLNTLIVNSVGQFLNFVSLVQFSRLCALLLHFIQCPFPNQIQFGLEKLHPKMRKIFQTNSSLVLERKNWFCKT